MLATATLLLTLPLTVAAFVVSPNSPPAFSSSRLQSTLAPTDSKAASSNADDAPAKGALSMSLEELAKELGGMGRAQLVWDCYSLGMDPAHFFGSVMRLGFDDFETIYNLLPSSRRSQTLGAEALEKLAALYPETGCVDGGIASLSNISKSYDGTTKLLLKLHDGLEVETVIIPWKGTRSTLCVSSQVGCRQGCKFCATGRMGKLRSLTSDEILAQLFFARKICRLEGLPRIANVVFMGMGESADNAQAVQTACDIMTTNELFQLSAAKVTVSTVAPTPDSFRQFAKTPCVLAWSVHAANDKLRRDLVPTTKYSMAELREGLMDTLRQRPLNFRTCMLEVALLQGVNDSEKAADELAEFARHISDHVDGCKLVVNLIPYNDIGHGLYQRPSQATVVNFQQRLQRQGVYAHVRSVRGDDTTAACGQLATQKLKHKKGP